MKQKGMILFVLLLLATPISYAQDKFTISGEVAFFEKGKLFIDLHNTQDTWEAKIRPPIFQVIEPNDEQKKASKVQFKFEGVPAGTYAIFAWMDVNRDGKLEMKEGRAREPMGTYRPSSTVGSPWNSVKFDLDRNLSGVLIVLSPQHY